MHSIQLLKPYIRSENQQTFLFRMEKINVLLLFDNITYFNSNIWISGMAFFEWFQRRMLFATIDHFFASMFPNLMDSWIQKDWIFQWSVLKTYPSEQQLNWISFQPMIVSDYKVKLQFFQLWIIKKYLFQLVIETIDWIGKSTNILVSKGKNELFIALR